MVEILSSKMLCSKVLADLTGVRLGVGKGVGVGVGVAVFTGIFFVVVVVFPVVVFLGGKITFGVGVAEGVGVGVGSFWAGGAGVLELGFTVLV